MVSGNIPRRGVLAALGAATGTGLAGCSTFLEDGLAPKQTATPSYGYGGSPTPTGTATHGDVDGGTPTDDQGWTSTPTSMTGADATPTSTTGADATSTTSTGTGVTPTGTTTVEDEYGLQGYGQYGYGG